MTSYYQKNREARLEYQKKYNEENKMRISNYFKEYYQINYSHFHDKNNTYNKKINTKKILGEKNIDKINNHVKKSTDNIVKFSF